MKIVPAILTDDVEEFERLVEEIAKLGRFERVQVDFIDGAYAANESITPLRIKLRLGQEVNKMYPQLKFDAQLMVVEKNLDRYVQEARVLGFDRIIPQIESISNPEDYDCLAMDFHSPVAVLEPYLAKLKYILVMSVEPGFGRQEFAGEAVGRIRELGEIREIGGHKYKIGVDGGVEKEHLGILEEAGVDEVCIGARRVLSW